MILGLDWTQVLVALISAGILTTLRDIVKWIGDRRKGSTPAGRQAVNIATVDQSLAVVAKARDELETDNALLRAMLSEERAASASRESDLISRHAAERITWQTEKADLKAEIADLERRLRELLTEVENIRRRTN